MRELCSSAASCRLHADIPPTVHVAHRTYIWIIRPHVTHAPSRGNDRLHYMCMPLTCWLFASACGSSNACRRPARHRPLQALAEGRTLVGCRHSVGDDHKGSSLYMPATAYACKKLERARLCQTRLKRNIIYVHIHIYIYIHITFTITFTIAITVTCTFTFPELMTFVNFITRNFIHAGFHATSGPGIVGRPMVCMPRALP